MKNIYNFTNIASHYRKNLWEKLIVSENFNFHFFFGKNKSLKIKEIDFSTEIFQQNKRKIHKLKNFWFKGKILIWQTNVIFSCLTKKIDIAIFLGEFQIISTWIAILLCKLRGIKVVYWTHGIYGNESFVKKKARLLFYKTADNLLLYERRAKKLLLKEGFNKTSLTVVYNSLDYDTHKKIRNLKEVVTRPQITLFKHGNLPYLIFVGRITKVKKIDILIEALKRINKNEDKVNLLLVGDGLEKDKLKKLTNQLKLEDNICFYGACYNELELANLIYHASLCVSPGNVGLTAIHSLSFGTPVCTHNNFYNQMPEVEVIEEGFNGIFFEENNVISLKEAILKFLELKINRDILRNNCYKIIDDLYNPYNQHEIIKSL